MKYLAPLAIAAAMITAPALAQSTPEIEPNNSIAQAQSVGTFSLAFDSDIGNSTTIPHVSMAGGIGNNTTDFYRFVVTGSNRTATFDIDYASPSGGASAPEFDSYLRLYNSTGTVIYEIDDSIPFSGDPATEGGTGSGGASYLDSYGIYTFANAGTYYIEVAARSETTGLVGAIPTGRNGYELQISLEGAATAVPEPAAWGMMIGGFGAIGGALRLRRRRGRIANAA